MNKAAKKLKQKMGKNMRDEMTPDMQSITFLCPAKLADRIREMSFQRDRSASELIRSCLILGLPLIQEIRGIDRVQVEDIRSMEERNKRRVTDL